MAATITELRDRLKIESRITTEESIDDSTVEQWIADSISGHNASYVEDGSNLPAREIPLVLLLAKIELALHRANASVNQNDLSGTQGYGQDRSSPFSKNMKLAADLRKIYDQKCIDMGIIPNPDSDVATVTQGTITKNDPDIEARTPFTFDPTKLVSPVLSASQITSTTAVLKWSKTKDNQFIEYILFIDTNGSIHQQWNFESTTGIPEVSDTAEKLFTIQTPDTVSLKLTGLTPATAYNLLVVVRNANRKFVYSNNLVVTTAAS